MRRPTLPALTAAGIALLLTAGGVAASALPTSTAATSEHHDGDLARDFSSVDRNTAWKQADKLHLDFPTFHTEGLAVTPDHLFLSAGGDPRADPEVPDARRTATTAPPARASATCS